MAYWWGSPKPKGSPVASERFVAEAEVWKNQLPKGVVKEVKDDTDDWDDPYWLRIEDIDKGWDEDNRFYVILTLRMADKLRRGEPDWEEDVYKVKVFYPEEYPSEAPKGYLVYPQPGFLSTAQHIYPDNELCLFDPEDGRRHGWNPAENTGVSIALWSIQWIRAYREYQRSDTWPGASAH